MIQYVEPEVIKFGEEIGSGATSVVYEGQWGKMPIAIKKFNNSCRSVLASRFRKELEILGQVNHANIIKIFGYCDKRTNTFIVCELMEGGTLYDYLVISKEIEIDWNIRLNFIKQIVNGMKYLHDSHEIYHLDLKSLNVLLNKDKKVAKLADFGLAKLALLTSTNINTKTNCARGTTRWLAPELTLCQPPTDKCDVWSFGAILLEFANRELPFYSINDAALFIILQNKETKIPITIDENTPNLINNLIKMCLKRNPLNRPSFKDIKLYLETNQLESTRTTPVSSTYDRLDLIGYRSTYQQINLSRETNETLTPAKTPTTPLYDNLNYLANRRVHQSSNYEDLTGYITRREPSADACLYKIIGNLKIDETPSTPRRQMIQPTTVTTPPPSVRSGIDTGYTYSSRGNANGRTIYQGPRGGYYIITSGGNKRYVS